SARSAVTSATCSTSFRPAPTRSTPTPCSRSSSENASTSCCRSRRSTFPGSRGVEAAAAELGYPERPVCFKPVFSSGSRGFRVLDATVDRAHQLVHERPGSVAMRLEEALELLPAEGGTELLVME